MTTPPTYATQRDAIMAGLSIIPAVWQEELAARIAEYLSRVVPAAGRQAPSWDFDMLKPLTRADYADMSEPEFENHWGRVVRILTDALHHGGLVGQATAAEHSAVAVLQALDRAVQSMYESGALNVVRHGKYAEVHARLTNAIVDARALLAAQPAANKGESDE